MNIKVSVIILTYNNFEYIEQAINSVISQNYQHIELIIQDDGSKNFNVEYIKKILHQNQANFENVIINHNKINMGTVKNFNVALELTTGKLIIPLACDDQFYQSTTITEIVSSYKKNHWLIASGLRRGKINNLIAPTCKTINQFKQFSKIEQLCRLYYSNFFSGSTLYYSKEFFIKYGYFDERFKLLEDYPTVLKAITNNEKIHFLNSITILYSEGGVSTSYKSFDDMNPLLRDDFKKVYELIIFENLSNIPYKKLKRYLLFRYKKNFVCKNTLMNFKLYIQFLDITLMKLKQLCFQKLNIGITDEFFQLLK